MLSFVVEISSKFFTRVLRKPTLIFEYLQRIKNFRIGAVNIKNIAFFPQNNDVVFL